MIRVEIQSEQVEERGGTIRNGARAGQTYHIRQQEAYLHNGHAYPERFTLTLSDDQLPWPKGIYQVAPESVEIGEYKALQFARKLVLIREAPAAAKTA